MSGVFAWYTWFNPDDHSCYYYEGQVFSDRDFHIVGPKIWEQKVNVSQQFMIWCLSGFVLCDLLLVYSLMGFVFYCTAKEIYAKLANCVLIMGYCLAMGFLVFGTMIRFSKEGIACSGEDWDPPPYINLDNPQTYSPYLLKTGHLIAALVIVMYIFYGCLCCCGCCAFIAVACGYRRELQS